MVEVQIYGAKEQKCDAYLKLFFKAVDLEVQAQVRTPTVMTNRKSEEVPIKTTTIHGGFLEFFGLNLVCVSPWYLLCCYVQWNLEGNWRYCMNLRFCCSGHVYNCVRH